MGIGGMFAGISAVLGRFALERERESDLATDKLCQREREKKRRTWLLKGCA